MTREDQNEPEDDTGIEVSGAEPERLLHHLRRIMRFEEDDKGTSFFAHYGMKDEEGVAFQCRVLADFFIEDYVTGVVDKYFPELDNEQRAKVLGFATAFHEKKLLLPIVTGKRNSLFVFHTIMSKKR